MVYPLPRPSPPVSLVSLSLSLSLAPRCAGTFDNFQYFQCAPCFAMLFKYSDTRLIPPEHRKKNVDDWTRLLQNTSGSSEVISELEQKVRRFPGCRAFCVAAASAATAAAPTVIRWFSARTRG